LRRLLLERLSNDLRAAGELGLAFLMTAGVASCGGTETIGGDGGGGVDGEVSDAGADREFIEAAQCDGNCGIEAAQEAGELIDGAVIEAAQEAGAHDGGMATEAASFEGGKP
jgi:hypothetical protein